jgi:hypothetical protein
MAGTTKGGAGAGGRKRASGAPKRATQQAAQGGYVCPVAFCPIGAALSAVQGAGPEVLDHLLAAAREFLLAVKALVDVRSADFGEGGGTREPLTKIEIG